MKKSRVVLEVALIFVVGAVWYIVLSIGMVWYHVRKEWRKPRHPEGDLD